MIALLKRIYRRLFDKDLAAYAWKLKQKINSTRGIRRRIYIIRWNKLQRKCGAGIAVQASFASKPVFPHGLYGIFISSGAKIGKNCVIFHQVTIGSNTLANSKRTGAPIIGDNVYIGAGAKIIGGITVGNNVRIGANCVVTQDIPDNTTVVLSSPRLIIRENAPNNTFVPWQNFSDKQQ